MPDLIRARMPFMHCCNSTLPKVSMLVGWLECMRCREHESQLIIVSLTENRRPDRVQGQQPAAGCIGSLDVMQKGPLSMRCSHLFFFDKSLFSLSLRPPPSVVFLAPSLYGSGHIT